MDGFLSRMTLVRQAMRQPMHQGLPPILMTDESSRDWLAAARALPAGALVIVRARDDAARRRLAAHLARLRHVRLLIADDPRLAADYDGLHLPERRAREAMRWRLRFSDRIVTAAAHSLSALLRLQSLDLDAVLLSPVFATASHPGGAHLTPVRAGMIAAASRLPVYALGGVSAVTIGRLPPAFAGIAAITALSSSG